MTMSEDKSRYELRIDMLRKALIALRDDPPLSADEASGIASKAIVIDDEIRKRRTGRTTKALLDAGRGGVMVDHAWHEKRRERREPKT
jgi:hypothetical protein